MKFRIIKLNYIIYNLVFIIICMVFLVILVIFSKDLLLGSIILSLEMLLILSLIEMATRSITITEKGVSYSQISKEYQMTWDEIKIIGIGYTSLIKYGKPPLIYFAADGISCPIITSINDKYFIAHHSELLVEEINKYWTKGIDGLNSESDFQKRIKRAKEDLIKKKL